MEKASLQHWFDATPASKCLRNCLTQPCHEFGQGSCGTSESKLDSCADNGPERYSSCGLTRLVTTNIWSWLDHSTCVQNAMPSLHFAVPTWFLGLRSSANDFSGKSVRADCVWFLVTLSLSLSSTSKWHLRQHDGVFVLHLLLRLAVLPYLTDYTLLTKEADTHKRIIPKLFDLKLNEWYSPLIAPKCDSGSNGNKACQLSIHLTYVYPTVPQFVLLVLPNQK